MMDPHNLIINAAPSLYCPALKPLWSANQDGAQANWAANPQETKVFSLRRERTFKAMFLFFPSGSKITLSHPRVVLANGPWTDHSNDRTSSQYVSFLGSSSTDWNRKHSRCFHCCQECLPHWYNCHMALLTCGKGAGFTVSTQKLQIGISSVLLKTKKDPFLALLLWNMKLSIWVSN